jgi:hypothetical protein
MISEWEPWEVGERVPFLLFSLHVVAIAGGAVHNPFHVPFHALLVEAIELEAVRGRWPRGPGSWDLLYSVEGMDKDSVWMQI